MTSVTLPLKKTYTWYIRKTTSSKNTIPAVMDWDEGRVHSEYLPPSEVALASYNKEWTDDVHATTDTPRTLIWRNRGTVEYFPDNIMNAEVPVFKHWKYIDKFIFFGGSIGEGNILAPDPWLIDLAHSQGVKIYGTVFLADGKHGGSSEDISTLTDNDNAVLKKIALIGRSLNIDGWFVNIESPSTGISFIDREIKDKINTFLSESTSTRGLDFITYIPNGSSPYSGVNNSISDNDILNMASGFNDKDHDLSVHWAISGSGNTLSGKQYLMFMDEPYWRSFNTDGYSTKPFETWLAEQAMDSVFNGLTVGGSTWVGLKYYTKARQSPEVQIATCRYAETTNLVNIAPYSNVSVPVPGASDIERIVDMSTNSDLYAEINGSYVQIDLKEVTPISSLKVWHYWNDARIYNSVAILASNDPNFNSQKITLFNNDAENLLGFGRGTDNLYTESSDGLTIHGEIDNYGNQFVLAKTRYLRFYSRGSNVNTGNHIVSIQINASAKLLDIRGTVNLAKGRSVSTSTQSCISVINPEAITDGINETNNYAIFPTGNVVTRIDLGKIYPITGVNISRNKGMRNKPYLKTLNKLSRSPFDDESAITIYNGPSQGDNFITLKDANGVYIKPVNSRYLFDYLDDSEMGYETGQLLNEIEVVIPDLFNGRNYARQKPVTSSSNAKGVELITDGETLDTHRHVNIGPGNQYVQIDLESVVDIRNIRILRYFGDGRVYKDVKVMVSTDDSFSDMAVTTTVFDNSDGSTLKSEKYHETSFGKIITFSARPVRYIRVYSNGSSTNSDNHYVEVEAYK